MRPTLRSLLAAVLLCAAFAANAQTTIPGKPCPALTPVVDSLFHPGDVWLYQTRVQDEGSTLTILKVESSEKSGTIVHIRVDGLHLKNPAGDLVPSIEHMPFARWILAKSVIRKQRTGDVPDFAEGYANWFKACGGVYTIPVQDAIAVAQKTFLEGAPAPSQPKP